jgi:hypothetical protein
MRNLILNTDSYKVSLRALNLFPATSNPVAACIPALCSSACRRF